ncbi:uncharacterized protein LOC116342175 [Contarinia nasturtii]|uniref:uncharacterized protein LOC116342175 n=1 Tax=Contarinia nasturtii TaxID=265458 RepID=UPI0012D439B0|nr:uncharacterized protein LOC116342175 [Contarinia nasturtii]
MSDSTESYESAVLFSPPQTLFRNSDDSVSSYSTNYSSISVSFGANRPDFTDMYEVSKIIDDRYDENGELEYLVEWKYIKTDKGNPMREWVKSSKCNCPEVIFDYQHTLGNWDFEYEIEAVIDSFIVKQGYRDSIEYLVKWKDNPVSTEENPVKIINEYSWVKKKHMKSAEKAIKEFEKRGVQDFGEKLKVDRILSENTELPIKYFQIKLANSDQPEKRYYSVDEVYLMPNGRNAICSFHKGFGLIIPGKTGNRTIY